MDMCSHVHKNSCAMSSYKRGLYYTLSCSRYYMLVMCLRIKKTKGIFTFFSVVRKDENSCTYYTRSFITFNVKIIGDHFVHVCFQLYLFPNKKRSLNRNVKLIEEKRDNVIFVRHKCLSHSKSNKKATAQRRCVAFSFESTWNTYQSSQSETTTVCETSFLYFFGNKRKLHFISTHKSESIFSLKNFFNQNDPISMNF